MNKQYHFFDGQEELIEERRERFRNNELAGLITSFGAINNKWGVLKVLRNFYKKRMYSSVLLLVDDSSKTYEDSRDDKQKAERVLRRISIQIKGELYKFQENLEKSTETGLSKMLKDPTEEIYNSIKDFIQ